MSTVWAQRREDLGSDCLVSPDVFYQMLDRLCAFVVPYQRALETETGQRNVPLYLQGLLSHLPGKNAEDMATFVDIERPVLQDFIGTIPWDHRPLLTVLVGQVAERLGEPDGIIAFDPSSFPKRGTHAVGVKRQWCSHRGKVDTAKAVCLWATSLTMTMPCSTSGCPCLGSGHETSNDAEHATCRLTCSLRRDRNSVWRCSTCGGRRCRTAG